METLAALDTRWLDGDDLDVLAPLVAARGWMPLNKALTRALATFDGEKVVGFSVFQATPMVSLWVDEAYRGTGMASNLTRDMVAFLYSVNAVGVYVVADNPHAETLAKANGMVRVESPVYAKVNSGVSNG